MHGTSGIPIPLTTIGGLVTLARPETVPEGASPRTYDWDYDVGGGKTRAGTTNQYPVVNNIIGPNAPNAASSLTWYNPANILLNDGNYTLFVPVSQPNSLTIDQFAFDVPATSGVTGILLTLTGLSNAPNTVITAQLLINGVPRGSMRSGTLLQTNSSVNLGGTADSWGVALTAADLNAVNFGVLLSASNSAFPLVTAFLDYATITLGVSTGQANFQFIDTFVAQNGDVKNLSLDADGDFYVENVTTAPGVQTLISEGYTPGSYMVGVNGPDVEYLALSGLTTGSDQPIQYTSNWIDRITQVGPGQAPVFTPQAASSNTYAIATITQPAAQSDPADPGHINTLQQSAGPTSTAPGNVITVFYAESLSYPEDTTLVNAFNSGNAVYVYVSGTSLAAANGTFLVTSVGNVIPPGGSYFRWYFTYQVTGAPAYQQYGGPDDSPGTYQQTLATVTMSVPVPGLTVGNNVTISGASVSAWDSTWQVTQTLNSSQMAITGSQVTANVATFNYALTGGSTSPPATGQLVTITGTTNADGALNGSNLTIVSASGGSTGTFTVNVSVVTAAFAPEDGQATTAGTIFCIDPGLTTLGTSSDPIFGNSTGGTLTFVAATAQLIATGTKQGSVFFITRNGYYTAPAPPVTFAIPENTTALIATQIPIGPPNVVARGIILTESGQNGVPGANFYTIPVPVTYIVENVSYTATALIINDNTSTSATFTFTDSVLLSALAVDVYAYNLFNQFEIGDPGWIAAYDGRIAYGLCRNKVQNFNNLSFDGGYLAGSLVPLGWTTPDVYGSLIVSAKFGNSYYIQNTSGGLLAVAGLIQQSAFQDAYKEPIIEPNTAYSVRVTAAIPSGETTGNLVVSLVANGVTFGSFTVPFSSMTTQYAIYEGALLTSPFLTTPSALQLVVQATEIGEGADVAIDRVDPFPTAIPILTTTVYFSYAGLPEQVDSVTGAVGFSSENQQPVNGGMVLYDTFYGLKGWGGNAPGSSLYSLQASSNLEPAQWQEPEVAQKSGGAIGPLAFDLGEQWFLGASRQGLYLFEGGQPGKIMQEIYQVWDAINWAAGNTIWVKVDIVHRKIYVGVPLPTPNFWLPNAPVNAAPSFPNVILMCNYQGIDSGQELKNMPQMHTTMFGTLNAIDMRRKWSIWQIPSPYANICQGATDEQLFICNGRGNSKIYWLDETAETDDGLVIDSLYTTAGLPELSKRTQMQGIGNSRLRFGYMSAAVQGPGNIQVRLLPNRLLFPEPVDYEAWQLPGGLTPGDPALNDAEASLNFAATRTFVEFRENDGSGFTLSNLLLVGKKDVWNQFRGRTGTTP